MAIQKAQQGLPTGHMVGVDAICSGIQIMSVMTGCVAVPRPLASWTPTAGADAYTKATGR
jgi:hypothetical protein